MRKGCDYLEAARREAVKRTHAAADRRALEMDRIIAEKVRENPQLVCRARATLQRWMESASAKSRPALEEWAGILEGPLEEMLAVLTGEDERSVRLRQSSPFCGILTRAERTALILADWNDQGAA